MILRRKKINSDIEEKILTGLIVSDTFCRDMEGILQNQKEIFESAYIQKISQMIMSFYKKYRKAPKQTIQDIFNTEKKNMKEEERELISTFLSRLSDEYDDANFNVDYLKDKAQTYFKKRRLKQISETIGSLIELDRITEAEKEVSKYQKISKLTSEWIDPFDPKEIKKVFDDEKNKKDILFSLQGKLGEFIGDFERNWLVAVLAPVKKGKTFFLWEIGIQGILEKLKVVGVSLEMNASRIQRRMYKRITSQGKEKRDYIFACFDCLKNQADTCKKIQRANQLKLLDVDGNKPTAFDPTSRYRVCTACRDKTNNFIPETWFTTYKKDRITTGFTQKTGIGIKRMFGDNFRLISFAAYSANVSDIKSAIDNLEYQEGFIPDIIIIDYADILAPEDARMTARERSDDTWKTLKNLSDTRHCLVVTASQSNRMSFEKKNVTQIDIAEDIRKVAHVDMMFSLNQSQIEKEKGVMRISVIAGRDIDFDQYKSATVLQQLELGQVAYDSEIIKYAKTKKEIKKEEGKEPKKERSRITRAEK